MLPPVGRLGQRAGALTRNGFGGLLSFVLLCAPALADDRLPTAEDDARALADEVLRKANGDAEGLGDWTRSVIGRALERAGEAAAETTGQEGRPGPLPAEGHAAGTAAGLAGRSGAGEVLVFLSLAVPPASWEQWARVTARSGVPLLLRGVARGGIEATVAEVGERLGGHEAGVAIDPRLFRLFGVERVPAVVVVPGGVPACTSRGCAEDAPPPFDRVTGNIGLVAALEAIAEEGGAGREIARRRLQRLTGKVQP